MTYTSERPTTDRPHLGEPILEVDDLHVQFRTAGADVHAVNGISLQLHAGETLAILGESGSGKSACAQAIMGILDSPPGFITGGSVRLHGTDLFTLPEHDRRAVRGPGIAMVFQDALTALNPVHTVGAQIAELFRVHRGASRRDARTQAVELLDRVGIPGAAQRAGTYPHQFSGGMRQRVMIAMAIALDPAVLIADEPTTALDVTVQAQIMELLAQLQAETGMGLLLITHDLGVVNETADRVAVMYAGRIVEHGRTAEVFTTPAHPYTAGLMASIPTVDGHLERLRPISGSPPNLAAIPPGCAFHPRCPIAHLKAAARLGADCAADLPLLRVVGDGRTAACHYSREAHHA
ncbi:methionine ABC transporter ATP-binding protein [Rhodococcus sp. SC4]|nr:methionine ABC transporter ATP-binding protein [Rhodococcus sp. SC4]